jgi:hypothetical protein
MSITAARVRRGFGFLAAIAIAAAPLLALPIPAAASSTGTLYSVSPSGFLVQVDQAGGTESPLMNLVPGGLPPGLFAIPGGFASDPTAGSQRLFGLLRIQDTTVFPSTWRNQVLTITPSTSTVTASQDLPLVLQSSVAFDSSSNTLYGITECCPSELVSIDRASGAEIPIAQLSTDMTDSFSEMAIDPAAHILYVARLVHSTYPPPTELLAINLTTPAASATPVGLQRPVIGLAFDTSSHALFGATLCCFDSFLVKIEPSGNESTIAEIKNTMLLGSTATLDSTTHTIYAMNSVFDPFNPSGPATFVTSVDDRGGVAPLNGASTPDFLGSLGFLPTQITADSIRAEVRSALVSGAIDNGGVGAALLAQLNAAAAARINGQCTTAASIYTAFIDAVNAQSGKHVAAATAAQLVSEAQFLVANCP